MYICIVPTSNTVRLILKIIWSSLITNSWNSPSWMKALACTHLESSTVTLNPIELANTVAVYNNRMHYDYKTIFYKLFFNFVLVHEHKICRYIVFLTDALKIIYLEKYRYYMTCGCDSYISPSTCFRTIIWCIYPPQ